MFTNHRRKTDRERQLCRFLKEIWGKSWLKCNTIKKQFKGCTITKSADLPKGNSKIETRSNISPFSKICLPAQISFLTLKEKCSQDIQKQICNSTPDQLIIFYAH